METEFINAYIGKQKAWIDELTSKWLLSEAKITILEKQVSDLTSTIQQLQAAKVSQDKPTK